MPSFYGIFPESCISVETGIIIISEMIDRSGSRVGARTRLGHD